MDAQYCEFLKSSVKLLPLDLTLPSNVKQKIQCLLCNDIFEATPKSKVQNFKKTNLEGCPKCTRKFRYYEIRKTNLDKLRQRFIFDQDIDLGQINNNTMLKVINKKCNHQSVIKLGNLLNRNVECPVCNTDRKRQLYIEYNEKRSKESLSAKKDFAKYKQLVYKITRQTYRKHKNIINPNNLPRARAGQDGYHLDHIVSLKYAYSLNIPAEITAHYENLRLIPWKQNVVKNRKPIHNQSVPKIFFPYIKSIDLTKNFVNRITEVIPSFKSNIIFDEYTLTLFDEGKKFGIMLLPLEENKQQVLMTTKHTLKMKNYFDSLGITLIIVFEDEWLDKSDLVISKIMHLFGCNSQIPLYARKCVIKNISNEDKNRFLNRHHIQGTCISQYNYGAFYNGELVAVMTFSKPRILMNKRINSDELELARFATHGNYRVVGIASKLLKYAIGNINGISSIYSYADRRWSQGNLYEKLGFVLTKVNPPEYYYIINKKRMHRWGFRKDVLKNKKDFCFDRTKTEYENMLTNNIDRIWDCGTLKYVIKTIANK
jgi:hypothetical protein